MSRPQRFEVKLVEENVPLTFDFSAGLAEGETLTTIDSVAIAVSFGTDATPGAVLVGGNSVDASFTKVIVPVKDGVAGCDYDVKVVVNTSNPLKQLALVGVLPVRAR